MGGLLRGGVGVRAAVGVGGFARRETQMKWVELWRMSLEGQKEAERLRLDKQANWTPL